MKREVLVDFMSNNYPGPETHVTLLQDLSDTQEFELNSTLGMKEDGAQRITG